MSVWHDRPRQRPARRAPPRRHLGFPSLGASAGLVRQVAHRPPRRPPRLRELSDRDEPGLLPRIGRRRPRRHEIERAAIVGISLGGNTALELALDTPERVTALVLVGAGIHDHDWGGGADVLLRSGRGGDRARRPRGRGQRESRSLARRPTPHPRRIDPRSASSSAKMQMDAFRQDWPDDSECPQARPARRRSGSATSPCRLSSSPATRTSPTSFASPTVSLREIPGCGAGDDRRGGASAEPRAARTSSTGSS